MHLAIITTEPKALKLNKANERDVKIARSVLRATGDAGYYARSLSAIHRSSSFKQQQAVEAAIHADNMQELFGRHPSSGAMVSAVVS